MIETVNPYSSVNPYSATAEYSESMDADVGTGGPSFARLELALRVVFYLAVASLFFYGVVVHQLSGYTTALIAIFLVAAFFEFATRRSPVLAKLISVLYRSARTKHAVGNWFYTRGRLDAAWHEFDRTTREHPDYAAGWWGLGLTYYQLQDNERSIECCDRAIELRGDLWQAFLARGLAKNALGDSHSALADLAEAIRQQPDSRLVLQSRASVFHEAGDSQAALIDLSRAITLHPRDLSVRLLRISILISTGQLEEAFEEATQTAGTHPRSLEAMLWVAEAARRLEKPDESIGYATRAIRCQRRDCRGWQMRATALLELGRHAEAIRDFKRALRFAPNDPFILNGLGLARHVSGDHRRAAREFEKAIAILSEDNDHGFLFNNRGSARNALGDYQAAADDYQRSIEVDASLANAYKNWAWQLATCPDRQYRDGAKAVRLATRAMELSDWKHTEWLAILAAAHAEVGDFEEAIARQLEADPKASERLALYRDGSTISRESESLSAKEIAPNLYVATTISLFSRRNDWNLLKTLA